jgi:methylenetetrahydrofolate dehydrogenase (NADP+)/methenyltetrahydrofolate cyclohydrolase
VRKKEQAAQHVGIQSHTHVLPETVTQQALLRHIAQLNAAKDVHGILVQMPLPEPLDAKAVANHLDPAKDVDGFHPLNLGKLCQSDPSGLVPCTPLGIRYLLQFYGIFTKGRHLCVVGRSTTVGLPASILALQRGPWADATVTVCHSGTQNLEAHTRQADVLIVAAGKPGLVGAQAIKPGAIVIDVGIHRQPSPTGKDQLVGDVRVDEAFLGKVGAYTPVPGGVGPLTVASLMTNVLQAWTQQKQAASS